MQKSIKIHPETYDKVVEISKNSRRPLITTLDIIVDYYMEDKNGEKRGRNKV